jgi:hypothetical protein
MVPIQKQTWKTNGTELKNPVWIYTATPTWFLTNGPKTYEGEKTTSSTKVAGKTGYLFAGNWN